MLSEYDGVTTLSHVLRIVVHSVRGRRRSVIPTVVFYHNVIINITNEVNVVRQNVIAPLRLVAADGSSCSQSRIVEMRFSVAVDDG